MSSTLGCDHTVCECEFIHFDIEHSYTKVLRIKYEAVSVTSEMLRVEHTKLSSYVLKMLHQL